MLLLINYFFVKNKILIDESVNYYDSHKKFVNIKKNTVPLSGGFFFFNLFEFFSILCRSYTNFFIFFDLLCWTIIRFPPYQLCKD